MPRKLEIKVPFSIPPKTARLKRRAMRKGKLSNEAMKLADDNGWILFYSFRVMPNTVLAYKDGDLWGPIFKDESVLELLVDEKLFGK